MSLNKILVIGDSCMDKFVYGSCVRLCPDAPVPVFIPEKTVESGGMALNVYDNIKCHGNIVSVDAITNDENIDKVRYVDAASNQMILRVDSNQDKNSRISNLTDIDFSKYNGILISDYNKGFLTDDDMNYICGNHSLVVVDTKKIITEKSKWIKTCRFLKLNHHEYALNRDFLHEENLVSKILITLGPRGCEFNSKLFGVSDVAMRDSSGAGDTFVSCFMVNFLNTGDVISAIKYANEKATIVVQRKGVVTWK